MTSTSPRTATIATPVTIRVADGVYYLPDTLILTPADSGRPGAPVVYRAVNEGRIADHRPPRPQSAADDPHAPAGPAVSGGLDFPPQKTKS